MNQKAKKFIRKALIAYASLAIVMVLIRSRLIPVGIFALIALDIALIAANYCSCNWLMDKAIDVSGIPKKEAYAYYSTLLGNKPKFRRRYWYRWVSKRTDNMEEFLHWDRLANISIAPSALFPVFSMISAYPGLEWVPNALLLAIPAYSLVMAYFGIRYHLKNK